MNTHRWTSSIVVLAVLCWIAACLPLHAQRPTRVWSQPELDTDIVWPASVVFQGRLTLLKRFLANGNLDYQNDRNHLWLTDGTRAGSELVFADVVLSNAVVHNDLLWFIGLGGSSAAQLYAFDGDSVTAVATLDGCIDEYRLEIEGNRLFIASFSSLHLYNLTSQTLAAVPGGSRGYLTDGNLLAVDRYGYDYSVRRLDAADEGIVVTSQDGIWLHNGLVYTGGEQLNITDGTLAGTRTVAIPEFSAVTEINEIYGVAGNQLLMGASISLDNTDPTGRRFLAACDLNGANIRVVNPAAPILIDHFPSYLPDENGQGLFLKNRDGDIYYSDGSATGTKLVFSKPPRKNQTLTQGYSYQNTNLLVYQQQEGTVADGAVYIAQGGELNPKPLFQESDRYIYTIYGQIGAQLLVSYVQKQGGQPALVQLGLLNPDNGTLSLIENNEDFADVDLPLSSLVQAGDTVAVLQNAKHIYDEALLLFHNKRTGVSQTHTFPAKIALAEHNGTIYVGQIYASSYIIYTWNETTAELERLITSSNLRASNFHFKVAQSETRTGFWNGSGYKVFDSATQMTTDLIPDIHGTHLGDFDGRQMFADQANIFIVNPELTAVQTVPLTSSYSRLTTSADDDFGYIGWYDRATHMTQFARVDPTGTVSQFSLGRPEQKINQMVSLSPQHVLVIDYNADAGMATLLAVNSDNETVTPLHRFSSRCVERNTYVLVRAGNRAYFSAFDETHGDELWTTDGTPAGTRMVSDLYPGARGSFPSFLKADGDTLTFRATGPGNQSQHWRLAPGEDAPSAVTDPALDGRVGLRLLGGNDDEKWYTSTERDLWWFHPQFPLTFETPDSVCHNGDTFTIHADAVHPDTQFDWTPINADLVEGQGSDTVTLRADGNGDVQINVAVILGDSIRNETLTLPLRTLSPAIPTLINGTPQPCALEENVRYTTPVVADAVSYEWSVPADAVIAQGQGSAEVAVTFGTQSGDVRVRALNACGASDWRLLPITLTTDGIVANAGEDRVTCNAAFTLNAELPADAGGHWTILDGEVTLSDITDPNAVLTFAATGSATLSWRIKKGLCPSAADTVTISYYEGFPLADAGDDIQVCSGLSTTLHASRPEWSTRGTWTVVSGEGGYFSSPNYSRSTFYGRPNEPYVLRWRITGTPCTESDDTVSVIFYGSEQIAAPAHQTISLGDSSLLEPTTVGGTGYWEILFGPNRNLSQLSSVEGGSTRFTPTHEGEYHLRWNYSPRDCDAVRVTTVVTVTNAAPFTSSVARFARPSGTATERNYFPVRNAADTFLIGAGTGDQPQNLVTPNGAALSEVFAGDSCTTTFAAPQGGVYAVTLGGAWAVNLYHRAANAGDFTFVAGTDTNLVGACTNSTDEHGQLFGDLFFFTLGQSLFALDLSQSRLDMVLDLGANRTDLLVWEGALYAAGENLWRYIPENKTFALEWYSVDRTLAPPIIKTSHGLFWTAYQKSDPNQTTEGLFFNNNPLYGYDVVAQGYVSGLAKVNDQVLFHHNLPGTGSEPWLSDGSEAGTYLLADLDAGPASSAPTTVQAFSHGGAAFFYRDGHLWRYQAGTEAPSRFVALNELRAYDRDGDNLLLWDGHRMRHTPANTPSAQISIVYELDFQDQADIDILGVWQSKLYLKRRDDEGTQVLAVPLNGGSTTTLNQDYRLPEATATYVGSWDDRLLLLDSASAFTLNRYDANGNVTSLITFPQDPQPLVSYAFNGAVFFTTGPERTLYRSNGTFSGTNALGSPALRQVEGVTKTANGILFFAENGSGQRHAYFCGVTGGPQLLGTGIQPTQPRSDAVSGRFHVLADSAAALFFLENSNGSLTLWRWMDNEGTVVRSNQFDNDPQRGVVAVADAQPTYCVFQISNTLYHFNGATQRVSIVTEADPSYQGTFDGTPLFTLAGQIGWVDRAGAWHQATPPSPIDAVRGKIAGHALVHVTGADAATYRWYALAHNRFEGTATLPESFAQIATIPGFLVFTTEQGIGVADRKSPSPNVINPESFAGQPEKPQVVTERALYYAHQPDGMSRFKGYRFSDSDEYSGADYLGQAVFTDAGAPAADYIRWVRRLGEGLVVCTEMPGMGQALWHLTNFSSHRIDTAPSPHPNYVVWAAAANRVVVADLSQADGISLLEINATNLMFTDPVLADHLLAAYDEDGNGRLDTQERATVTDLDLSGLGLQSLDGIDLLPNLRALDLSDNLITDLGPLLDHPSLGDDSGDFLDVSRNPLADQHCIQIQTLTDRAFTEGDNLIISPNKVRGNPSYDTWPQNSILQLLRPGFTVNPQPWFCATR